MINQREKEYLYWLVRVTGIGAVKAARLLEHAGSFEAIFNMKEQETEQLYFLTKPDRAALLAEKADMGMRREEYHRLREQGIQFITAYDGNYPKRLLQLPDKPVALFVKGRLPDEDVPTAAIIGARSCSYYGRSQAARFGRELAEQGIQVVSGLAYGIDGAGHQGTLDAGGAAFAVLGSGIDNCYPRQNWALYNAIPGQGGIISEYGPGTAAQSMHFPVRNRIISGLSDVLLVIEARKRSGSLITVGLALEQGKEVFALPGRISDPLSTGCNELIKDGAGLLLSPSDVTEYLGINSEKKLNIKKKTEIGLAKNEKKVYSCLDSQPKHLENIICECRLPAGTCRAVLLKLELDGYVVQPANQYYVKKTE